MGRYVVDYERLFRLVYQMGLKIQGGSDCFGNYTFLGYLSILYSFVKLRHGSDLFYNLLQLCSLNV